MADGNATYLVVVRLKTMPPIAMAARPKTTPHVAVPAQQTTTLGGPQEKKPLFQIASGLILINPIHPNSSKYDTCKVCLKKMTTSLPAVPPKFTFFVY
jgi:hypothetical protein